MTGTSIVTQNVTTFIKNSANFEKYFLPGVVAFEDFRKAFSYHFGCQNFLGLLLQQPVCYIINFNPFVTVFRMFCPGNDHLRIGVAYL